MLANIDALETQQILE